MLGLTQVGVCRVVRIHAKSPTVGEYVLARLCNSDGRFSVDALTWVTPEGHRVDRRQPHSNMQSRTERANPLDHFAKKARAAFEAAAVASLPRVSAEKLMAEIAVAMLNVHEIETQLPSQISRPMEVFDDRFDFTVTEQRIVGGQLQPLVQ